MAKQFNKSALLLLGLSISLPAAAAQVTISNVVDLSGAVVQNSRSGDFVSKIYDFPPSVQIGTGDTVDMTINFLSEKAVHSAKGMNESAIGLGVGSTS